TPARWFASSPCACPTSTTCSAARGRSASTPATAWGATTRSTPTACSWPSPSGGPAPISTVWPGWWRVRGRGSRHEAGRDRHAHDLRALAGGPAGVLATPDRRPRDPDRGAAPRCRCSALAARAARGGRAGDRPPLQQPVEEELRPRHGLLPAWLVHDEVQPEAQRAGRGTPWARPPASAPGRRVRAGCARAHVAVGARTGRDRRAAARLTPAERGLARRARGAAPHP